MKRTLILIPLLLFLFFLSQINYLFFHTLVESFALLVAVSIFIFAWSTREIAGEDYLLFLGLGYLALGGLTFFHMITYSGLAIFPDLSPDPATQFWMAARFLETLILLLFPLFLDRKLGKKGLLFAGTGFGLYLLLAVVTIMIIPVFPSAFVEGVGLTPFKVYGEYVVVFFLGLAIYHLYRRRDKMDQDLLSYFYYALGFSILAELSFTLYTDVYGFTNFLGHTFYFFSLIFILRATVLRGVLKPQSVLYHNLKQMEGELREINRCFLSFGPESKRNIEAIVETAGRLLDADYAFYNEVIEELLFIKASWNIPQGLPLQDQAEGHLCEYVVNKGGKRTVVINNLQQSSFRETDPAVRGLDLQTYLGFPVYVNNQCRGTLCVLYQKENQVTDQQLELLETLGRALGIEVERSLLSASKKRQLGRAKELQESLFPSFNPELPGMDLAHLYRQAEEFSGDYYDFDLNQERFLMLMVDVTGHGMDAALITVFVSSFFRRQLNEDESLSPTQLLQRLETDFRQQGFPADYSLEVFLASLDLSEMKIDYAAAGSIRALILPPGGEPHFLPESWGTPINNAITDTVFGSGSIELGMGEALLIHTDGIDEPFLEEDPEAGLQRLGELKESSYQLLSLQDFARRMVNRTLRDYGSESPADDMAVVGIKRKTLIEESLEWECPRVGSELARNLSLIMADLSELALDHQLLQIALFEVLGNAIEHSDGTGPIKLSASWDQWILKIIVDDGGSGFQWEEALSREAALLNQKRDRGRGLHLIDMAADSFTFNDRGNRIIMQWHLQGD